MKAIVESYSVVELTDFEILSTNGGVIAKTTSFWEDVGFLAGAIVKGAVIFATEGGRNAGLCVR